MTQSKPTLARIAAGLAAYAQCSADNGRGLDMSRVSRVGLLGVGAGVVMALALFITGAVAARVIYGPQMVPEGKFTADQINAVYFLWTKLLIGVFFGVVLSALYEMLPLAKRIAGIWDGLLYAFLLWVVVYLRGVSHPFV